MDLRQKTTLLFILPGIIMLTCPVEIQAGCCCPALWTAYRQNCYRLFSYQKTWHEAESFCRNFTIPSLGYGDADIESMSHLVSIHSQAEHDFVTTLLESSRYKEEGRPWVWIGLHDTTSEAEFEWSDGTPLDFLPWAPGQPDNHGSSGEDCGHIRADKKWNDLPCDRNDIHYIICKLPIW